MAGRIPKVIVVGPSYIYLAVKCEHFPSPGKTVCGSGFSCMPMGSGPNRAIEATLCDCETYLLSKVGEDVLGEMARANLRNNGVNIDFVYTAPAISTGTIVTMVDSLGENSSCVCAGANRSLGADEVGCASVEQLISSAEVCLIHDDLAQDVVTTALKLSGVHATRTILETSLKVQTKDSDVIEYLAWPTEYYGVDVLIPNFHDSDEVLESGASMVHELKFIASELVARGVGCVVLKMGSRGCFMIDREGTQHVPGFEVDVVDHTCGGDAFAGALAASFGAGDSIKDAVRFASAAEALTCSKFGCQDSLATKQGIIELLQTQGD